jgi:PAS domain S-box-containing protein
MTKPITGERQSRTSNWIPTRAAAFKIAGVYAVASFSWIALSDWAIHHLNLSQDRINFLENVKGWLFVLVTALLLGAALTRYFGKLQRSVTEQQATQAELERQSALIKSLLDSIPDLIFYKDLKGVYLGCNPAFAEFAGRPRERIIGKTDLDLFEREVAEGFRAFDQQMLSTLVQQQNEEWVEYPNGRRKWVGHN